MKKKHQPNIQVVCPDCGMGVWAHNFLSQKQRGVYKLYNVRLRRSCNVVLYSDGTKQRIVPMFTKAVKRIPRGKRRERRGPGKPR